MLLSCSVCSIKGTIHVGAHDLKASMKSQEEARVGARPAPGRAPVQERLFSASTNTQESDPGTSVPGSRELKATRFCSEQ